MTATHLTLSLGELIHLRGENGVGKTTMLRALAGELPYQGVVQIQGHPPGSRTARARTAFVSTEPSLLDDLTVQENFQFMAAAWNSAPASILELAHASGLSPWLDAWRTELSQGPRQKGQRQDPGILHRPAKLFLQAASQVVAHREQHGVPQTVEIAATGQDCLPFVASSRSYRASRRSSSLETADAG